MNDTYSVQEDVQSLRDQLARVRAEAEEELAHLRGDLAAVRELAHPERDVDKATEDIALWQEVDTLRKALREKERLVDATAAQCRRLEDELEDHHQAYDGLKQDLEQNKLLLAEAREVAANLGREREAIAQRLAAPLISSDGDAAAPPAVRTRPSVLSDRRFVIGLVLGGTVAAAFAGGGLLWLRPDSHVSPRVAASTKSDSGGPPHRVAATVKSGKVQVEPGRRTDPRPAPVEARTVRDRLRDGTAGPLMIALPGGTFQMGWPRTLPTDDDGPPHKVRLQPFLIGATEVTFDGYDRYARATGGRLPRDFGWGRGRRPVVDVSWGDAKAYAQWVSAQTGKHYRLPSEAEWEYAARAGQPSIYWWGYRKGRGRADCFDCGSRWDNRSTAPVASFPPNPFGLYDTVGNVMEWVEDCYHPSYIGAPADGHPWEGVPCAFRVARSGAFNKPAASMRDTSRHEFAPDTRINIIGFRITRDE
jgi:formylglycine-generating enzyme required for sulfatase activity